MGRKDIDNYIDVMIKECKELGMKEDKICYGIMEVLKYIHEEEMNEWW